MGFKFNPLLFSGFSATNAAGGSASYKDPVATASVLPTVGNTDGDIRSALDTDKIYAWDGTSSKWIDTGVTVASFGSTPNSQGLSLSTSTSGNITSRTIALQPADATNPGSVSTGAQTIAGAKTFSSTIIGDLDKPAGTLALGTSASIVNIGGASATVNITGSVNNNSVTNLNVSDALITINDGGGAGSASATGLEIEENAIITGYNKTSADRNSWELKAPATAGVAVITPGSGGITLSQSSHDPLTLATAGATPANAGASISGQVLTLQPADATHAGLMSTTTQTIAGAKTFTGAISASNLSGTNSGDVTLTAAGSSPNSNSASLSGQVLTLQPADATNPGIVSTTTQSFAGNKTFTGTISSSNFSGSSSGTNSGDVTLAAVGSSPNANGASLSGQALTLQPADATNPGVITTGTQTIAGAKTFSTAITASLTGTASGNLVKSSGDLNQTNFSITNNQASAADITSFLFANGTNRSFKAHVSVKILATSPLYEEFDIEGIQKASDWYISYSSLGDNSQIGLSITSAGQLQYTSGNYTGFSSGALKFRAITTDA